MDKESIFELQKIDCNCNDCKHLVRDIPAFEKSLQFHEKMQRNLFNSEVERMKEKAKSWRDQKNDLEKWCTLLVQADKMKFQFDKSAATINYGSCAKLSKQVSFIPNTCQLETQI